MGCEQATTAHHAQRLSMCRGLRCRNESDSFAGSGLSLTLRLAVSFPPDCYLEGRHAIDTGTGRDSGCAFTCVIARRESADELLRRRSGSGRVAHGTLAVRVQMPGLPRLKKPPSSLVKPRRTYEGGRPFGARASVTRWRGKPSPESGVVHSPPPTQLRFSRTCVRLDVAVISRRFSLYTWRSFIWR